MTARISSEKLPRALRFIAVVLIWGVLGLATLWAVLALRFDVGFSRLRMPLAATYGLAMVTAWMWVRRPWKIIVTGTGFIAVLIWWLSLAPSNTRDWLPDVAVLPFADILDNQVTIHNVRNCDYRTETDFDVHYYDRTYNLEQLRSVDLYLVNWGSPNIAHTMVSFGFGEGGYVCFSIETRKEKGEEYSAVKGLFRQFELIYIIADERDLVRLRTNFRQNEVACLYRIQVNPAQGRKLFNDYLRRANELHKHPEWYNALTDNCTTGIRTQRAISDRAPWDWRILVNGHLDELLYERGMLASNLPFAKLKRVSQINPQARAANQAADFSQEIRHGLPGFNQAPTSSTP